MHFSEDDLRSALRRKDPGTAFTRQVVARINREAEGMPNRRNNSPSEERSHRVSGSFFRRALASAFLFVLLAAAWIGIAKYREAEERRAGEFAGQQAIAALRITTEKLNHVIGTVQAAPTQSNGENNEEN
jgi:hypothetical protein